MLLRRLVNIAPKGNPLPAALRLPSSSAKCGRLGIQWDLCRDGHKELVGKALSEEGHFLVARSSWLNAVCFVQR